MGCCLSRDVEGGEEGERRQGGVQEGTRRGAGHLKNTPDVLVYLPDVQNLNLKRGVSCGGYAGCRDNKYG